MSSHVLTNIAPVALIIHINTLLYNGQGDYTLLGCLYIIKSLYNHPLPVATGAIVQLACEVAAWCSECGYQVYSETVCWVFWSSPCNVMHLSWLAQSSHWLTVPQVK